MIAVARLPDLSRAGFDGQIFLPGSDSYDQYRRVWNGLADRRPMAIVRASSVDDVKRTIGVAAEKDLLLAVRCGGHSLPGLSTVDGGIVLDLSAMNAVSIDPLSRTAEVSGGALLGQLDAAASAQKLVTPAGVISHTGVAGLTLGGGMGWLSRRFGLTVDNLLGAEVVTAAGRLIWTDAESEPELFWGLRGGGGNFGVVTRFKFRMHLLDPIIVGCWSYDPLELERVLPGFERLSAKAPRKLTTNFSFGATYLTITACWSGALKDADAMVAPFGRLAVPTSGGMGPMEYVDLQRRHDEAMAWGRRYYSKGGFLGRIDKGAIERMRDVVSTAPTADSDIYVIALGGAIGDVDEADTPYSGRAANYYWITAAVWDDPQDDARCIEWGRSSYRSLAAISMQGNYVNEQADSGRDVAFGAYGAEKYARLARIKAKFDPANLFRLNQNIEPAV